MMAQRGGFKILIVCFLLVVGQSLIGQQKTVLSQYMFNGQVINPAYSGVHEKLSATALYRNQWVNLEGAPTIQTLTVNSGFKRNRTGVGIMISNDKLGIHRDLSMYLSYSYKIQFRKGALSMGLQGGFNHLQSDFNKLNLKNPGGPILAGTRGELNPNFGAGLFYYSDIAYVGVSVPYILSNKIISDENIFSEARESRYYFLTMGRAFQLNKNIIWKPSFLIRFQEDAPLGYDINTNFVFHELVTLGVSYRSGDAFLWLFELQLNDKFRFGYAYDMTSSQLNQFSNGTHELMLNYRIDISRGISGKFIPCPNIF
jgi:type IX secretion system PorP/SprF family membrane protein